LLDFDSFLEMRPVSFHRAAFFKVLAFSARVLFFDAFLLFGVGCDNFSTPTRFFLSSFLASTFSLP